MSDNPRDADANRLTILRINHPAAHASLTCATCFLLAQIDTRDTALREARQEIKDGAQSIRQEREEVERLNAEIASLRSTSSARVVKEERLLAINTIVADEIDPVTDQLPG